MECHNTLTPNQPFGDYFHVKQKDQEEQSPVSESQELTPSRGYSLNTMKYSPVTNCMGAGPCNISVLPTDPRPGSKACRTFSFRSYWLLRNNASITLAIRMDMALSSRGDRGHKQVMSAHAGSVPGNQQKVPGLTRSEPGPAG